MCIYAHTQHTAPTTREQGQIYIVWIIHFSRQSVFCTEPNTKESGCADERRYSLVNGNEERQRWHLIDCSGDVEMVVRTLGRHFTKNKKVRNDKVDFWRTHVVPEQRQHATNCSRTATDNYPCSSSESQLLCSVIKIRTKTIRPPHTESQIMRAGVLDSRSEGKGTRCTFLLRSRVGGPPSANCAPAPFLATFPPLALHKSKAQTCESVALHKESCDGFSLSVLVVLCIWQRENVVGAVLCEQNTHSRQERCMNIRGPCMSSRLEVSARLTFCSQKVTLHIPAHTS